MNAEIKTKWLEALRSGKYKQAQGVLRTADNTFCCLGVLCDIMYPDNWGNVLQHSVEFKYLSNRHFTGLPIGIREEANLSATSEGNLVCMNDTGKSFEKIADYIETDL